MQKLVYAKEATPKYIFDLWPYSKSILDVIEISDKLLEEIYDCLKYDAAYIELKKIKLLAFLINYYNHFDIINDTKSYIKQDRNTYSESASLRTDKLLIMFLQEWFPNSYKLVNKKRKHSFASIIDSSNYKIDEKFFDLELDNFKRALKLTYQIFNNTVAYSYYDFLYNSVINKFLSKTKIDDIDYIKVYHDAMYMNDISKYFRFFNLNNICIDNIPNTPAEFYQYMAICYYYYFYSRLHTATRFTSYIKKLTTNTYFRYSLSELLCLEIVFKNSDKHNLIFLNEEGKYSVRYKIVANDNKIEFHKLTKDDIEDISQGKPILQNGIEYNGYKSVDDIVVEAQYFDNREYTKDITLFMTIKDNNLTIYPDKEETFECLS